MYDLARVLIYTNIFLIISNGFCDFSPSMQRRTTVAPHRDKNVTFSCSNLDEIYQVYEVELSNHETKGN
jgi:hypothetical protein